NQLVLLVDPVTGQARVNNGSGAGVTIDGYSILSSAGSLRPGDGFWNSLADQATTGWVEATPTTTALSELSPTSQSLLSNGGSLNLGALFNPAAAQDLSFE